MGRTASDGIGADRSEGDIYLENPWLMRVIYSVKVTGLFKKVAKIDGACRNGHYRMIHDYKTGELIKQRHLKNRELDIYFKESYEQMVEIAGSGGFRKGYDFSKTLIEK